MRRLSVVLLCLILWNCSSKEALPTGLVSEKAMVVAAREEAAAIGSALMEQGGNAFDAMVATEMALAVSYPVAGNLGGGGFMVYRLADGTKGALDYREKAPRAAHRDMYLDSVGEVIDGKSTLGALAIGVPGTVAGIIAAHQKLGSLPLSQVLEPVIALAEKGVVVTEKQDARLAYFRAQFAEINGDSTFFAQPFVAGDTIRYPALAKTLRTIAQKGQQGFYSGEVAQKLVDRVRALGGIISLEDLADYKPVWRDPISFDYQDIRITSMSPPSSGGMTLNQIFRMIESYDIGQYGHNSEQAVQLFTEAARRAYADRNYYLGDPDFVDIPVDRLLSPGYLESRMASFNFEQATPSTAVSHGEVYIAESMETTHYSIVDPLGNAVAVTTTLNGAYGSKVYMDELGFFLNNEMDDFSAKAGTPNMFGLTGAEANSIAPGKRMLSSMTPTLVEKEGKLWLVVGTPGGSTIITAVAQTILNVHAFGMGMQEAVTAPRFHHQWLPDEVIFEPNGFPDSLKEQLRLKGYHIEAKYTPIIGKVDAIRVLEDGRLEGGADPRGDDTAVGF